MERKALVIVNGCGARLGLHRRARSSGRQDVIDVLLLDGGAKQTLTAARSLGRAGLRLALAECRDA